MTAAAPAMVGFARALRAAGVGAGPERVHAWADALAHLDSGRSGDVYWSGRLTLCSSPDDLAAYDAIFRAYFGAEAVPALRRRPRSVTEVLVPVAGEGAEPDSGQGDDVPAHLAMASRAEVLRHRDLAALTPGERAEVDQLLAALRPAGPIRLTRRRGPSHRGQLDPRRTVREMLRRGGEPARLLRRDRRVVPRRLVLLIDVSGSMGPYADGLLRFAHAACRRRRSTEVFTMGTRLTRISRELVHPDPDRALGAATEAVPDWSGGTRLGDQLKAFLDRWGQRGTARGAVVVVASDGWERGDVSVLAEQMVRLRRLAHRVVWVSPHAGKDGFVPATAGLRAAAPSIDALLAGHSVHTLGRLATILSEEDIYA